MLAVFVFTCLTAFVPFCEAGLRQKLDYMRRLLTNVTCLFASYYFKCMLDLAFSFEEGSLGTICNETPEMNDAVLTVYTVK